MQAKEAERESNRLQGESKRMLEVAKGFHKESRAKHCQNLQSYFKMLWQLVGENDPFISTIPHRDIHLDAYPQGHGKILGKALLNNTHVTSIHLHLDLVYPKEKSKSPRRSEYAASEAKDRSASIENILRFLESSPSLTHVRVTSTMFQIPKAILDAVAANPMVVNFSCSSASIPTQVFLQFVASAKSITDMNIDIGSDGSADRGIDTVVELINLPLKKLKLQNGNNPGLTQSTLMSFIESKPMLLELQFCPVDVDESVVAQFLQATTTLQTLGIIGDNDDRLPADTLEHLIAVLQRQMPNGATCVYISKFVILKLSP
jgi:hypothetical protein